MVCCSPWGHKEPDMTEQLNNNVYSNFSVLSLGYPKPSMKPCFSHYSHLIFTFKILYKSVCSLFQAVQFSHSVVSDSLRPHESQLARPPCPSPTPGVHSNSRPSSRWCHPAISSSVVPSPPAPNPSQHQGLFRWVNSLHEAAKVLFSFSISPSNEHPGLIFRMDWLDLLAVQGTLKSLLQHHSSKVSILHHHPPLHLLCLILIEGFLIWETS